MTSRKTVYGHKQVCLVSDEVKANANSINFNAIEIDFNAPTLTQQGIPISGFSTKSVGYSLTVPQTIPDQIETTVNFNTLGGVDGKSSIIIPELSYTLSSGIFTFNHTGRWTVDFCTAWDSVPASQNERYHYLQFNGPSSTRLGYQHHIASPNLITGSHSSCDLNVTAGDTVQVIVTHRQFIGPQDIRGDDPVRCYIGFTVFI